MDWTVTTYVVYLLVAVPLTIWVATTLSRNGRVFLEDVFSGTHGLAAAVNRLLVVGFYLLNLGFVSLYLQISTPVPDLRGLFEELSVKIGVVTITLGAHPLLQRLRLQLDPPPAPAGRHAHSAAAAAGTGPAVRGTLPGPGTTVTATAPGRRTGYTPAQHDAGDRGAS